MSSKIAIVGMEVLLGPDEGLDAFDRTIFDGIRHAHNGSQEDPGKARAGARAEYREDYLRVLDRSRPLSASSLIDLAIDGALRNSGSGLAAEGLRRFPLIVLSEDDRFGLETASERIVRKGSLSEGLRTAADLLAEEDVRGVLLAAVHLSRDDGKPKTGPLSAGEGAAALLLKRLERAREDRDRLFASIDAVAFVTSRGSGEGPASKQEIADAAGKALVSSAVDPQEIACLESPQWETAEEDPKELEGLIQAYGRDGAELSCALGSVRANVGGGSALSGLAGLVKTALSLYHRYVPGTPGWTAPKDESLWKQGPFYVPSESRPWFPRPGADKRRAALSRVEQGVAAHMVLSEEGGMQARPNRYLSIVSPYCFPIAGDDGADMGGQLEVLKRSVEAGESLIESSRRNLLDFQSRTGAAHALMLVGHSREELAREIGFMLKGIPKACEEGTELKTPKGSYFTGNPLGAKGKVAFVYPGVGSAYVGLGQGLFHLFPELYEKVPRLIPDLGGSLQEKELYPRTLSSLTEDEIWKRELKLRKEGIVTIGESGTVFFVIFTMILRDVFGVRPDCALGYSLGEPGMIASLGVWEDLGPLSERFRLSPAFQENLSGKMTSVQRLWKLSEEADGAQGKTWDAFTLQASAAEVGRAIAGEERVYLTIINAPEEVVIAGDPENCRRVIRKIGCKHYPLGLNLALHCPPAQMEYDRIVELYTLPVFRKPEIKFYSSSCYKPIPLRSKAVAHSIAKAYSEPVDFPRLVNQVYEDGARLFIELGSRKFCSNLIDRILQGKEHLTMAVNVKGTKDQASLVRVLAQLVSHRVPVDLSRLF